MNVPYEELFDSSVTLKQNEWTHDALQEIPTCKGVFLFADASGQPIQLLQAANLRRTTHAKLLRDDSELIPRKKADVSDVTSSIYYTCCYNNFLSQITYTQLAHMIFEKNAGDWVKLPKVSLAEIDMDAFLPFFYVSNSPAASHTQQKFGLFPTRKAAMEFCEILNTAYHLCRNPSLLKSGREQSCSYLQMQTCPGPCLDPEQKAGYLGRVHKVVAGECRHGESSLNKLHQRMHDAANAMDFEKANVLKKQINLLKKLQRPDFQYVHGLENLCFLHVDIGPKIKNEGQKRKKQQFMWFKVTSQGVYHLGDFVPDTENSITEFLDANWFPNKNPLPLKDNKELLPLLSLHLYRSQRAGVWIDCTQGIWLDAIIENLNNCFGIDFPEMHKKRRQEDNLAS